MEVPKFCPNCGAERVGEMRTCVSCGKQLAPPAIVPTPPEKPLRERNRNTIIILLAVIFGGCWVLWSISGPVRRTPGIISVPSGGTHQLIYRVSGSARLVDLTYNNAQGGTEQQNDRLTPWEASLSVRSGHFAYISAQNQGESGRVKCEILLDGVVVKTSESSGAYVIATCSGRV